MSKDWHITYCDGCKYQMRILERYPDGHTEVVKRCMFVQYFWQPPAFCEDYESKEDGEE